MWTDNNWGQKERRASDDNMTGWHHQYNKYEFWQTLGDSEGQGGLACCSPWGGKESDMGWETTTATKLLELQQNSAWIVIQLKLKMLTEYLVIVFFLLLFVIFHNIVLVSGVHACLLSLQSCPTLCDPVDYSLPGSSVHGIFQVRILECLAVPSSRGSSWSRSQTQVSYVSCFGRQALYHWCHLGSPNIRCIAK